MDKSIYEKISIEKREPEDLPTTDRLKVGELRKNEDVHLRIGSKRKDFVLSHRLLFEKESLLSLLTSEEKEQPFNRLKEESIGAPISHGIGQLRIF